MTNLHEKFGKDYIVRDDGTNDPCRAERPWCMEIPGQYGTIYPYGFGFLAVWTASHHVMRKLAALQGSGVKCIQGGGFASECSYRFPLELFRQVAAIVRSRKRRKVSPELRAQLVERLRKAKSRVVPADSKTVSCPEEGGFPALGAPQIAREG